MHINRIFCKYSKQGYRGVNCLVVISLLQERLA